MIFNIRCSDRKIFKGYSQASEILSSDEFAKRLSKVSRLTYTKSSITAVHIDLNSFLLSGKKITVNDWHYRSSSVIGTTFANDPAIYVNLNAAKYLSVLDYVDNAAHEFAHRIGYSHGSNFPPGSWRGWALGDREDKYQSVPYLFGRIASQIAIESGSAHFYE